MCVCRVLIFAGLCAPATVAQVVVICGCRGRNGAAVATMTQAAVACVYGVRRHSNRRGKNVQLSLRRLLALGLGVMDAGCR